MGKYDFFVKLINDYDKAEKEESMTDIDKILDEKIDEILLKYAEDNFLQTGQVQAHIDAKEAIKQLIEEEIEEDNWHRTIGDE